MDTRAYRYQRSNQLKFESYLTTSILSQRGVIFRPVFICFLHSNNGGVKVSVQVEGCTKFLDGSRWESIDVVR